MSIFKILIGAIIFIILLYFVLTLFVLPKTNVYPDFARTINLAIQTPGEPNCSLVNIAKDSSINTKTMLQELDLKNKGIFVWFSSLDSKYSIFKSKDLSSFNAKQNYSNLNYCVICFPPLIFENNSDLKDLVNKNNYFCEIVFGNKLLPLNNNLVLFSNELKQGIINVNNQNMQQNYNYEIYVFNSELKLTNDSLSTLKTSADIILEDKYLLKDKNEFELKNSGNKIVLQAIVQENKNIFSNVIFPVKFLIQNINVLPNEEYLTKDCKVLNAKQQYFDYDKQKCVVYNYCSGCTLASYCADAWKYTGIDVEAVTNNYAISYLPECNKI